jgi:hypothetical protein
MERKREETDGRLETLLRSRISPPPRKDLAERIVAASYGVERRPQRRTFGAWLRERADAWFPAPFGYAPAALAALAVGLAIGLSYEGERTVADAADSSYIREFLYADAAAL